MSERQTDRQIDCERGRERKGRERETGRKKKPPRDRQTDRYE